MSGDAFELFDVLGVAGDAHGWLGVVAAAVVTALVAALLVFVVLPALVLVLDLLLLAVLLLAGAAARVLLRRPWRIDAVAPATGATHTWAVTGWRASGTAVDQVAAALAGGEAPDRLWSVHSLRPYRSTGPGS